MNTKLSILFFVKRTKTNVDGLLPIFVRVTVSGARIEFSAKRFTTSEKSAYYIFKLYFIRNNSTKLLLSLSLPLILHSPIKCNKVKHFTHSGTNTIAIVFFKLWSRKISGGMSQHVITYKMVIPGKQNFAYYITLIAVVFKSTLGVEKNLTSINPLREDRKALILASKDSADPFVWAINKEIKDLLPLPKLKTHLTTPTLFLKTYK